MPLNSGTPQRDDPSKTTNANNAFETTTLPLQGTPSTGGAMFTPADTTVFPSLPTSDILHSAPSNSWRGHGPVLIPNPPSATDATAPGVSQDPLAPVNPDLTPSTIIIAIPSATTQPNALPPSQSSGLTHSQNIAAILLPIIALLIILVPIACICTRHHRRLRRSTNLQSDREMKPLSPRTTSGWLPMTSTGEHGIAQWPVPAQTQTLTQVQEPDVIPRRTPTMNSGYYSGLDQSSTQHRPPTAGPSIVDDPPPPYVPRTAPPQAAPELTSSNVSPPAPTIQRQLQLASLSEANLIAHAARVGTDGPRSPFEDADGDDVSEISSLEEETSRERGMRTEGGRRRESDEISVVSAAEPNGDRRRSVGGGEIEAHQIV